MRRSQSAQGGKKASPVARSSRPRGADRGGRRVAKSQACATRCRAPRQVRILLRPLPQGLRARATVCRGRARVPPRHLANTRACAARSGSTRARRAAPRSRGRVDAVLLARDAAWRAAQRGGARELPARCLLRSVATTSAEAARHVLKSRRSRRARTSCSPSRCATAATATRASTRASTTTPSAGCVPTCRAAIQLCAGSVRHRPQGRGGVAAADAEARAGDAPGVRRARRRDPGARRPRRRQGAPLVADDPAVEC